MVQTFADEPNTGTAKIKPTNFFNSSVGTALAMQVFVTKIRTVKISSGASCGVFAKVSRYTVIPSEARSTLGLESRFVWGVCVKILFLALFGDSGHVTECS